MELNFLIKNHSRGKIDKIGFEKIIKRILADKGIGGKIEISLLVCGERTAKKLNQEYRKMSYIPQVLGFPMSKEVDIDGWLRLGDIVVCFKKLKEEMRIYKKTEEQVWEEWLRHGVENLLK
ncbi:MAG: rRNA maturation RNase YbeY [Candidatus Shapirobacteria bacterium]|jgi:rRNA maturation RNase YbeY